MLSLEHPVRTERLLLRPIDPVGDVDAIHAYASREDVCRYIPWTPRSRDEVAAWLPRRTSTTIEAPGQGASLAITLAGTGELVGDAMIIWASDEHRTGELGYVVNPAYAGHGYATEAARAVLAMAFDRFDLRRVVARVDARNPASAAVLRKLGMRQEAVLVENEWFKGAWSTEIDFALLQREWWARDTSSR
ncbi:MAG: GNAT family N-acetyltransferase [Janthinobacterium lividum]